MQTISGLPAKQLAPIFRPRVATLGLNGVQMGFGTPNPYRDG
jgi:hypothetical protein